MVNNILTCRPVELTLLVVLAMPCVLGTTNVTLDFDPGTNPVLGPAFVVKTTFNVTFNYSHEYVDTIKMKSMSADPSVADLAIDTTTLPPCHSNVTSQCTAVLALETFKIGRTLFNFTFFYENDTRIDARETDGYNIRVIRKPDPISYIYGFILLALQIVLNFLLGCRLNLDIVIRRLKKPVAVLLGVACQIIVMPLLAFLLSLAFSLPNVLAIGLLVMGCSPGGGSSNYYSVLLDGDIDLSITMTVFTITLSFGTMPLWIFVYSRFFIQGLYPLRIPYIQILITVAATIAPLFPGLALRKCKPIWAKKLSKVIMPFVILLLLLSVGVSIYNGLYIWEMMTWQIGLSSLVLPLAGLLIGGILAAISCRDFPQIKTIAVETGVQNSVIAIGVVTTSQGQPEADIMLLMPSFTALFIIVLLFISFIVHKLCMKCSIRYSKLHECYLDMDTQDSDESYNLDAATRKSGIDHSVNEEATGKQGLDNFALDVKDE